MVTFLYKRGANPNIFDSQGYNSLHLASHGGHAFMILYLLAIGMDVNVPDSLGRTALMWCAYQGNSLQSLRDLIRSGASLDAIDSTGYTALHWAVMYVFL